MSSTIAYATALWPPKKSRPSAACIPSACDAVRLSLAGKPRGGGLVGEEVAGLVLLQDRSRALRRHRTLQSVFHRLGLAQVRHGRHQLFALEDLADGHGNGVGGELGQGLAPT